MSTFAYQPHPLVPFRDLKALARARAVRRTHIARHRNPKLHIQVLHDSDVEMMWVTDIFKRLYAASRAGERITMILPNPCPSYRHVARLINELRVDCSRLRVFAMDEYANEHGEVAPVTWEQGFGYALLNDFVYRIDSKLRPPMKQVTVFTTRNVKDYGKMIADAGHADAVYTGPGWTGHLAFVEPDAPEFDAPLEEWLKMGPRICTLSPFTLAQNSLHGAFGSSGDIAAVPPKAATIGPAEVVNARYRLDVHSITVHHSTTSWQRLMTRLCLHGPVTPKLPTSIHQLLESDVWISETAAADIEADPLKGY
jgi:glucosamine-6-phosphate deaminase